MFDDLETAGEETQADTCGRRKKVVITRCIVGHTCPALLAFGVMMILVHGSSMELAGRNWH